MPKRTNQRLPSCLRDPSRRLHPLRELSSVPVETSPIPASSLESGTSFVGEALNFEGPIPKDHLTKEADSQGESVETSRGLYSDPETEVDLRAVMSPVVPCHQGILSSRKDKLLKLSENLLARQSSEKIQKKMRTNGWSALNNILPTTDGYFDDAARSWFKCTRLPNEWMVNLKRPEDIRLQRLFRGRRQATIREIQETFKQVSATGKKKNEGVKVPYLPRGRKLIFRLINLRGSQKISTVGSPVLKKGDLSRVKREIGYLFAEMSHPLLGQRCDRGEEIIGRSPL
ncbi:hypothetical protein OUZ56_017055 [Daphnia magna]|uniref:Uncharacterized protein n=1 Tax=Daphnia magna TaxID=35525 RepID=A0ABR0AS42_9CRUS|nr:hypothetical protein OUZ56_017055 [Daphnia magna]